MDSILMPNMLQVHLWTGNVYHVVDLDRPRFPEEVEERRVALCGFKPLWPGEWVKYEPNAVNLSPCRTCDAMGRNSV